jgi:hypothetical protein
MTQRHCALSLLILALSLLLPPNRAAGQAMPQPNPCVDWVNVQSWSGSFTVSGGGTFTGPTGAVTTVSESGTVTLTGTDSGHGPCRPTLSLYQWLAVPGQASISDVSIHDITLTPSHDTFGNPCTVTTTADIDGGTSQTTVSITLDSTNKASPIYKIAPSLLVAGVIVKSSGCGATGQPATYLSEPWGPGFDSIAQTSLPLPNFGPNLPVSIPLIQANGGFGGGLSGPTTWSVSGSLIPFIPPLDVVVMIPQYATWRPTGGRNETDMQLGTPGNILGIQAQLIRMDTKQNAGAIEPDGWTFNLVDVSHEPGVALNWPAQAMNPAPPDLAFNQTINQILYPTLTLAGDLSNPGNGTILQLLDPLTTPVPSFINLALFSFDWGAWATLHVTAVVNGQQIQGHIVLDNGQNTTDILLPKRQPGSFIADSWKTSHGVPLATADSDDSEKNPNGNGPIGDGFTLYEEYRGFYMGCASHPFPPQPEGTPNACQRVEGDPKMQDIFVVDQIGAPEGIGLFAFGASLNVHYNGLEPADIGPKGQPSYRVVNFNHSQQPGLHQVMDQHALVLVWGTNPKNSQVVTIDTYVCQDGSHVCPALPKDVDHIEMNTTYQHYSKLLGTNFNVSDKFVTDVAHELSHAVDVYHHGDRTDHREFWSIDPNTNSVRTQLLDSQGNLIGASSSISVLPEDGDPTAAAPAQVSLAKLNLDKAKDGNPIDVNGRTLAGRFVLVGNAVCNGKVQMNGQHSGDQIDFMRYNSAEAYIPAGFPGVRFWTGGNEPAGVDLTNHPVGTGVNDPGRRPRPRYGDADVANQRGNDRDQVSVNDNGSEKILTYFVCPGSN